MFAKNSSIDQIKAINKSQAVIEFTLDGTIINANQNFLNTMGYTLEEIKGKHHSMFAEPAYAASAEYQAFWHKLRQGEYQAAEYKRLGKNGREVWIQASYNPIMGANNKPYKIIKFATDITQQKLIDANYSGQIAAINKSQAVIEFELDGTIINANQNFLKTMGYTLEEIKGKHHSMFAEPAYAASADYQAFWDKLRQGAYQAAEYKRLGKNRREVWIQASYNPIFDMNNKPYKIIKYATDITEQKLINADYSGQIAAIGKSLAVIEFELDGTIINANQNFLKTMGYTLEEIKGKHHSMFAEPAYAASADYQAFWDKLRQGEYQASEYKRLGKNQREVWIQASYNPIFDMNNNPFKIVKFATDITPQMLARIESKKLTDDMSGNIESVSAAASEMTAAVNEISSNMARSKNAVENIAIKTRHAEDLMNNLSNTAKSMEDVVELIRNIASQVNLLALNATIEAARAGEAGKGFAVVASEVKNLASQTSSATDDIASQIIALQAAALEASQSAIAINQDTGAVTESVGSVAAAIDQQSAVTKEVAENMTWASTGIMGIKECINRIANAS